MSTVKLSIKLSETFR